MAFGTTLQQISDGKASTVHAIVHLSGSRFSANNDRFVAEFEWKGNSVNFNIIKIEPESNVSWFSGGPYP